MIFCSNLSFVLQPISIQKAVTKTAYVDLMRLFILDLIRHQTQELRLPLQKYRHHPML